jgi:hypothetical protein
MRITSHFCPEKRIDAGSGSTSAGLKDLALERQFFRLLTSQFHRGSQMADPLCRRAAGSAARECAAGVTRC